MSLRPSPAARRALRAYRGLPKPTRAHVLIRWLSAPLPSVTAALPRSGRILDIGCGHGLVSLLAAAESADRHVHGVDVDTAKIAEARRAAATFDGPVTFEAVPVGWQPPPEPAWDAIVICDVLYLLGPEAALALVRACADALAPGGTLVIKEIDVQHRWKHRLAVLQDLAATRLAKVTEGEVVRFVEIDQLLAALEAAGLRTTRRAVDRGYPHPHLLVTGTKP